MSETDVIAGLLDVDEVLALVARNERQVTVPGALGTAAERFARNTLRKPRQAQRTYLSLGVDQDTTPRGVARGDARSRQHPLDDAPG